MLQTLTIYRTRFGLRTSSLLRQFYMPGVRGAVFVLMINLVVIIIIKAVTVKMMHEAMHQKQYINKATPRRLNQVEAYARIR